MKTNFDSALSFVLDHEGTYSNDTLDRGGETFRGISSIWFPNWSGWKLVDAFKNAENFPTCADQDSGVKDAVRKFYRSEFADKIKFDELNDKIDFIMFDTAVNLGCFWSVTIAQRAFNNLSPILVDKIDVDGIMGEKTLFAVNSLSERELSREYLLCRVEYYADIRTKGDNEKFFGGWINRTLEVREAVMK